MKGFFLVAAILLMSVSFLKSGVSSDEELRIITEITQPAAMVLDNGELGGFGVDIVEAIKKEIGCNAVIEVMPWARGYKYLKENPNIMLFPTTRTFEREKLFHWVGPIAQHDWVFYGHVDKKHNIKTLDDAKKVSGIGVYRDDVRAHFLESKGFTNLEVVNDQRTNFRKLERNRIDLVVVSSIGIEDYLKKNQHLKGIFVPVFTFRRVELYLAFSQKTNLEIVHQWDKAFRRLKNKGVIKRIQQKWM
ncbi:substrate-binding periplasmic protein [Maridesulfovibrio hydrothermalis]|uniref:Extracellular solute-binding protein family 3 n=1 Tax=Maridesulfovibrio hydrothermalis AM13 = DSM 14728 TaxID=1121451 RepID=L0R8R3_9BACT|nr:ABC transporter substrate-binding protein [Maridesulfovibrio hydrothermalis]CCO22570.1 Extracellular solute-binding protein family 3 [Maridesulfovibrio hydrothermalis AM13 = DSM 14728]